MALKRLVLLVEGEGDVKAAPILVGRLISDLNGWDCIFLDPAPMRVGCVTDLCGTHSSEWARWLRLAVRRKDLGGVLLLLDGDVPLVGQSSFCPRDAGIDLAARARPLADAGKFSVACVFAMQEYESWLIAGVESLAGQPMPSGFEGVRAGVTAPPNVEIGPRNAKGWLSQHMAEGYSPTHDQAPLTSMVDLDTIRQRNLRSFRRLEQSIARLIEAIRTGQHIVSPE